MGQFASVDIHDLERASRFGETKATLDILERRPDLNPMTVLYLQRHPRVVQRWKQHHQNHQEQEEQAASHLEPSRRGSSLIGRLLFRANGGSGHASSNAPHRSSPLTMDLLQTATETVGRFLHVPTAVSSPTTSAQTELQRDILLGHDSQDFVIEVPAVTVTDHGATMKNDSSSKGKMLDGYPTNANKKKSVLPDTIELVGFEKPTSDDVAICKESIQEPVKPIVPRVVLTSVATKIFMSPMAWAVDQLNLDLVRTFLDCPVLDISKGAVAYIAKDRVVRNPKFPMQREIAIAKYTMTAMEYALAFKMCPHLAAEEPDTDVVRSNVEDLYALISGQSTQLMHPHPFDVNRVPPVSVVNGSVHGEASKKLGGEPLLHLAIKYFALYQGGPNHPRSIPDSERLWMDEERIQRCDNGEQNWLHSPAKRNANEKIWCRRHHALMPISKRAAGRCSSLQLIKQETLLRQLLTHPDLDLFAAEQVDQGNALHYTVIYDSQEAAQCILHQLHGNLKKRRDLLEHRDRFGFTPLHLAVKLGRFQLAHFLLCEGANYFSTATTPERTEERPIDIVFQNRHHDGFLPLASVINNLELRKVEAPRIAS